MVVPAKPPGRIFLRLAGCITGQKKTTRRSGFSFDQRAACEVVDPSNAHFAPEA
jgi:hypothetical protein